MRAEWRRERPRRRVFRRDRRGDTGAGPGRCPRTERAQDRLRRTQKPPRRRPRGDWRGRGRRRALAGPRGAVLVRGAASRSSARAGARGMRLPVTLIFGSCRILAPRRRSFSGGRRAPPPKIHYFAQCSFRYPTLFTFQAQNPLLPRRPRSPCHPQTRRSAPPVPPLLGRPSSRPRGRSRVCHRLPGVLIRPRMRGSAPGSFSRPRTPACSLVGGGPAGRPLRRSRRPSFSGFF